MNRRKFLDLALFALSLAPLGFLKVKRTKKITADGNVLLTEYPAELELIIINGLVEASYQVYAKPSSGFYVKDKDENEYGPIGDLVIVDGQIYYKSNL